MNVEEVPGPDRMEPPIRERVMGLMLLAGGALAGLTVALPPAASGSEAVVLGVGAVAIAVGMALMLARPPVPEPVLGAVVAFSTLLISVASAEGGGAERGTADNEMLYLWVCLVSFYFFALPHALFQLALVGAAYATVLSTGDLAFDDGASRWLVTMVSLLIAGLVISQLRKTLQRTHRELFESARHDSLTGLLNRRALEERAEIEFARARREDSMMGMVVIDIDGFKQLNDTAGHPAGDAALRTVGRTLIAATRETDAVARLGGDEFALLLAGATPEGARRAAERVRSAVENAARKQGRPVTLSVGAAVAPAADTDLRSLWKEADRAMYVAKRRGGHGVAVAGEDVSLGPQTASPAR